MTPRDLTTPWATRSALYSAPGGVIVKLQPGEAPEAIPTALDVRLGAQPVATQFRVGSVDRILRNVAEDIRIVRAHSAAAGRPGEAHAHYDDVEHATGLSRTFRVQVRETCSVDLVVDALRQLALVEEAYPHYLAAVPFDAPAGPFTAADGAAWETVRAAEAAAYEPGDPAVIVAIVDTGVRAEHAEWAGALRAGVDTVQLGRSQLAAGLELVGDLEDVDTDPDDLVGHGTACAGIIGARGQGQPPGLAGRCGLLPIRALGAARCPGKTALVGVGALADINEGVKRAIDLGAKVVNMSFGTPESELDADDPRPHADVVRYGLARGCVMVAASGNSGEEERYAPASLDGVIAVAAAAADGRPAPFSTRGGHVALAAPGERVFAAGLDGYQRVTGTSFAAPFVAAAAALLVSRAARRAHPLDGRDVRRLLTATARPWPDGTPGGSGVGVLDAAAALRALDAEIDAETRPRAERGVEARAGPGAVPARRPPAPS